MAKRITSSIRGYLLRLLSWLARLYPPSKLLSLPFQPFHPLLSPSPSSPSYPNAVIPIFKTHLLLIIIIRIRVLLMSLPFGNRCRPSLLKSRVIHISLRRLFYPQPRPHFLPIVICNINALITKRSIILLTGYYESKLSFCRIGNTAWTTLDGQRSGYRDVMYFSKDQKFCALSAGTYIEARDLCDPASPNKDLIMSHVPPCEHPTMDKQQRICSPDHYLVDSLGELLMVVRYYCQYFDKNGDYHPDILFDHTHPKCTIMFDVYKLNFVNKEWVLLPSLGNDTALFTIDFPGFEMNCIYFTSRNARSEDSHDLGIFSLEDNCITPIYQYDLKKITLPSPWIVPAAQQ